VLAIRFQTFFILTQRRFDLFLPEISTETHICVLIFSTLFIH